MSVREVVKQWVICDGNKCDLILSVDGVDEWDEEWKAEAAALSAGWTEDGALHYCPGCAEKEKSE